MKKYFRCQSVVGYMFKNIPAYILGTAVLLALIHTASAYVGVRGIKLNTIFVTIGLIFFEILMIITYKKFMKYSDKHLKVIITIELAVLVFGLIIAGGGIQLNDLYDFEYMHMAALSHADTGSWGHVSYFSRYPKQRNWTVILGFVYKLEKSLGITDYRIGGIVVGIVLTFTMVYFSGKIVAILLGKKAEAISLLFLILNPTFYIFVSFYYKDIPGPMCEVLVLYLVLKGSKRKNKRYYIIAGMIAGIGCFILESVGIGLIAAALYIIFDDESKKIRRLLIVGVFCLGVLCLLKYGINIYYEWNLDENKKYPLVHWLLLGLYGNGTYSREMSDFTNSFSTFEEKQKEDILKIIEVVKDSGFSGMLQLWISKQCTIFGDGIAGIARYASYAKDYNTLWRYTIGPKRLFMEYYAQIYRCMILLNCFGAIVQVLKNKFNKTYLIFICVFGHILYHSFFETKDKYILTFLPLLIVLAVVGFHNLVEKISIDSKEHVQIVSNHITVAVMFKAVKYLCVVLSFLSLLIFFSGFKSLFRDVNDETAMRAANKGYGMSTLELSNEKVIGQTFRCKRSFNSIQLQFNTDGSDENVKYKFELLNSNDEVIVYSEFDVGHISDRYIQFDFEEVVPNGWEDYVIQVSALDESESYISIYGTRTDGEDDFYNYGEAIGTNGYMNDLYFVVNEKYYNVPYYPMRVFVICLGVIVLVEIIPIIAIRKI